MTKKKAAIVIPSRFGSNRFPGKALQLLDNKPIIQHVWERCTKSLKSSVVVVATDDQRIASAIEKLGGDVITSKTDHANGTERCAEFATLNKEFETIINVQGDEVFVNPVDVDQLIESFETNSLIKIASLYHSNTNADQMKNTNCVKVSLPSEKKSLNFFRSNKTSSDGVHIGIYGFSRNTLLSVAKLPISQREKEFNLEQLRWLDNGYFIQMLATSSIPISINVPSDIKIAREYIEATLSNM